MERSDKPSAGQNSKANAQPLSDPRPSSTPRLFRSVVEFVGEQPSVPAEPMPTLIKLTIEHACVSGYVRLEGEGSIECPGCGRRFAAHEQLEEPDPAPIPVMTASDPVSSHPASSRAREELQALSMWEHEFQFPSRERRPTRIPG